LNECTLDGVKLDAGGQIARLITMAVFGAGKQIPGRVAVAPAECENFCCSHPDAPEFVMPFENVPGHPACGDIEKDKFPAVPPVPGTQGAALIGAAGSRAPEFRVKLRGNKPSRLAY
jgi:hypothetical protein